MIEYKSWSQETLKPIIKKSNETLTILDIQSGGCDIDAKQLFKTYASLRRLFYDDKE